MPQQAVFIDQMPEFQQAAQKIAGLDAPSMNAAAQELGLGKELEQVKGALGNLNAQGQMLDTKDKILHLQEDKIHARIIRTAKDAGTVGTGVEVAAGIAAGVATAARKTRFRLIKVFAATFATTLAAALAWTVAQTKILSGSNEERLENDKKLILNKMDKDHVSYEAVALQQAFITEMATRMLDQQKTIGDDGKLVSTAQPSTPAPAVTTPAAAAAAPAPEAPSLEVPAPAAPAAEVPAAAPANSMAEKYATPPAASKAVAIVDGKTATAVAQVS